MNANSKICCFIATHENWETDLTENYGIKIKKNLPYAIFNYGLECDFANPIVQEARGIIINLETLEVVCWPFRKFGNYNESYADIIDWETARVQEKVDGSIIKYWFDEKKQKWVFSTNGMIYAEDAVANEVISMSFLDVIHKTPEYVQLSVNQDQLNKEETYIFELVSPFTQVIIRYSEPHLFHIGTRNRKTGQELEVDLDIPKPKQYPLKSLEDCMQACANLNRQQNGTKVKQEGFVVVDGNWNRVKIKSPEYLLFHRVASVKTLSKDQMIEMIRTGNISIEDLCNHFPECAHVIKYYEYKIMELEHQANLFGEFTKRLYEEYQHDRKAVAMIIKKHRFCKIGFLCLDRNESGRAIMQQMPLYIYSKWIPTYEEEQFTNLLTERLEW